MAAKPFIVTITGLSGAVESGGLLYSFVRSTSTPRPLYTDVGLSVPAENPVEADALGLIAVYFNDALEYTWRAKTADDATTLFEADVIGGVLTLTYINPDYSEHPIIEASWVPALGAPLGSGWQAALAQDIDEILDDAKGIRICATYAEMTALSSDERADNAVYCTYGRVAEEDGGFGFWRYDSASTATADSGTILAIDGGGAGRFFRLGFSEIDARWFGVKADGSTDDASAMATFLTAVETLNMVGLLPVGTIYINSGTGLSSNVLGLQLKGAGIDQTIVKAGSSFAGSYLLRLASSSEETYFEQIAFDTTGKSARCVSVVRGQTPTFYECQFKGNQAVSLFHSTGDIVILHDCRWDVDGASTIAAEFDEYNQNCTVSGGRVGGIGKGFLIAQTGSNDRVEGMLISSVKFINTGEYNIKIGNSLMTQVSDCICDQAEDYAIYIHDEADQVTISDNWLGLSNDNTGVCVYVHHDTGGSIAIDHNAIYYGATGVTIAASASARVDHVTITDNNFAGQASQCLSLDSVAGCIITGNTDAGTPASGSWITSATHASGGIYQFDNNRWHTAAPAAFHTTSVYRAGEDTGIVWRARGRTAPGGAATSLAITHGLFRAPTLTASYVNAQLEGHQGDPYLTSVGSTTFTVNWTTSTTPTVYWEAKVA